MGKTSRGLAIIVVGLVAGACNAAEDRVDPADLELRDLLGIAPSVAARWDAGQRAAAREVLGDGLAMAQGAIVERAAMARGRTREQQIAGALAAMDRGRAAAGHGALGLVRITVEDPAIAATAVGGGDAAVVIGGTAVAGEPVELWLDPAWAGEPRWDALGEHGLDVLGALARDGGHERGAAVVAPVPRLAVVAAYAPGPDGTARLLVNPVVLAAMEPEADAGAGGGGDDVAARAPEGAEVGADAAMAPAFPSVSPGTGGNPYSFYGSVAECASAQLRRCEACLPAGTCAPVTDTSDGDGECTTLAAAGGRGAFLLCANLALSITSVGRCVRDDAPATCSFTTDAGRSLATLEENARFVDDAACGGPLDACLAEIYGAPGGSFPGVDGGTGGDPPRETSVSCGNSCDDNNANCSPSCGSCDNSGPSCNNSLSCGSACSGSNEQSGCGGNCEACSSSGGAGGSTSAGCGGCDSDGSSGGGGCSGGDSGGGGGCDGCSGDSGGGGGGCSGGDSGGGGCSGGSCGGGDSGGSCGGGGGGCGDSGGGGGCGGGGGGGSCNSGGGGGSCSIARRDPPPGMTLAVAVLWALLPIPAAALLLRRRRASTDEPDAEPGAAPAREGGES